MELKQNVWDCFEIAADFAVTHEESAEMIVPDSSPDISRIVSAEGEVFIRSAEARDGKAEIAGVIQISLLYIPEKTPVLQVLEYTMPFLMIEDCPKDCGILRAKLHAEEIHAKALNPRKVYLQCKLGGDAVGYRHLTLPYTEDLENGEKVCAEKLVHHESVTAITALEERDFSCEETLHLPQNRGAVSVIVCSRIRTHVGDSKLVGKRMIVKGDCFADFLIRYENGHCESSSFELPFSHITDLDVLQESAVQTFLQLTSVEARLVSDIDSGSEIRLSLFGKLQLTITERRELRVLSDLYSTVYETEVDRQELQIYDPGTSTSRRQIWQNTLEVGLIPERILWVDASCGPVSAYRGAGREAELRTLLRLRVLYAGEEGRILAAERSAEVLLPMDDTGESIRCRAVCGREVSAVAAQDGLALRVPVDFTMEPRKMKMISCVKSVRYEENKTKDTSAMPSLVLRRKKKEESLWQIAKQHNTACADILLANGCREETDLKENSLLLIPKKR